MENLLWYFTSHLWSTTKAMVDAGEEILSVGLRKKQQGSRFKSTRQRLCQHPAFGKKKKKKEIKLSKQDTNQPLVFTRQIPLGWCWCVLIVACREPKSQAGWEVHYLCNSPGWATPSLARAAKLFWRAERGSAGHPAWQAGSARNSNSGAFAWNVFPASTLFSHSIVPRTRIVDMGTPRKQTAHPPQKKHPSVYVLLKKKSMH